MQETALRACTYDAGRQRKRAYDAGFNSSLRGVGGDTAFTHLQLEGNVGPHARSCVGGVTRELDERVSGEL